MSEAHRPGPWRLSKYRDGSSIIIIDAEGFAVATVHYPNRDATARLIVSAPDLAKEIDALKAENERLRAALHKLACLGNGDRYGTSIGNQIAQEALAARGGV